MIFTQSSVLSTQSSALSPQYSVLSTQYSVLSPQSSALSPQSSVLSPQHSVLVSNNYNFILIIFIDMDHANRSKQADNLMYAKDSGQRVSGTTRPGWEHLSHAADIGVCGYGSSMEEAFAQAALALTAIVTDPGLVRQTETVQVTCECPDNELLFVDWLNAVIYAMVTRNMLFSRFRVEIHDGKLSATLDGEAIDRDRHEPAVEPKGATYTELKVERQKDGRWMAQCIIDV